MIAAAASGRTNTHFIFIKRNRVSYRPGMGAGRHGNKEFTTETAVTRVRARTGDIFYLMRFARSAGVPCWVTLTKHNVLSCRDGRRAVKHTYAFGGGEKLPPPPSRFRRIL